VASFAAQAGVALELAATGSRPNGVGPRGQGPDRQDLHDLVIQRPLRHWDVAARDHADDQQPEVASRITNAVDAMDETIKEIRLHHLPAAGPGGGDRAGSAREIVALVDDMADMLGFAPSLRLGAGLGGDISPE